MHLSSLHLSDPKAQGNLRTAPKVMTSILWYQPTMSGATVGGMAVKAEPSHQHSMTCCCCVTDGSRGALWQNGAWHGSAGGAKRWNWIPPCRKNGPYWHSSMLVNIYGAWTAAVSPGGCRWVFQQWQKWQSLSLVQIFTSVACRLSFISSENAQLLVVTMLKNSVL